ncbi:MAG: hypothetical protein HUK15_01185, partial [Bacteroidales bacterium]|nr:hypothetical protein [Bacteroidales bacterium]
MVDTLYYGYAFAHKKFSLPSSGTSSSTSIKFITDYSSDDKNAIAYINVRYPHTWNFENASSFEFELPENPNDTKDYLEISNFSSTGEVVLYDLTNHERIVASGEEIKALVGHTDSHRNMILVGSQGYLRPARISKVTADGHFTNYIGENVNANFIIVTHKNYIDECKSYAAYRNSTGYKAMVVDIAELYDQFGYGISKSPMAVRMFCKKYYETYPSEKYLFLVGRGLELQDCKNSPGNSAYSTVPSAGNPSSDVLFTVGLCGTNREPLYHTGRLAVTEHGQLTTYLDKLRIYEAAEPASWMKEILHFGGGANASEQASITNFLNSVEEIISDTLFGGNVHTFLKTTSAAVTTTNADSINNLINNGVSIMTFYGHGSSSNFDHEIEAPSFYNNEGKYPFIIGNSCYVGAIHSTTFTLSDSWIKSPKGAIGFLSSMDQGNLLYLSTYSRELYRNFAYKLYGQPVGKQISNTLGNILNDVWSMYVEISSYQITLHGDPAVVINSNKKPDLAIDNSSITLSPTDISTAIDSFDVSINIKNYGMA